ncbi:MAG: hypothetical protein XD95_0354 [Microgenomates bacterium 39_7]|nr:MAG: hypothetical protein XD95_0354 [Microgenomates bacterium 39_7]
MFAKSKGSSQVMQKKIPTVVGLLVLIGALVAGLLFFGEGTGVFAPRATAETTPKNIRITNVKDDSFSVSFYTDKETTGFVKYGTEATKLNSQAGDDRDQLSGTVGEYSLHHITVRGLSPATEYYFVLGTESRNEFDNDGQPFSIITPSRPTGQMPPAVTIYGSISNEGGTPAEGSIIYVDAQGMGPLSSLVKGSGSWAIPLSQALTADGSDYMNLESSDSLNLFVQGIPQEKQIRFSVLVSEAQPTRELSFGQTYDDLQADDSVDLEKDLSQTKPAITNELDDIQDRSGTAATDLAQAEADPDATVSGRMQQLLEEAQPLPEVSSASSELVLGESPEEPVYTTSKPVIKGLIKPNVEVKISVHSETQYETTLTTSNDGSFELDLEELGLDLEPGEHTVTYSYVDPETGEEVSVTENFWVEDSSLIQLAQADTTSQTTPTSPTPTSAPYGTGSPYPMSSPTPTATPTTPSATDATTTARQQPVGTEGALAKAGSIGATMLVAFAGLFFILIGSWSWWLAAELDS